MSLFASIHGLAPMPPWSCGAVPLSSAPASPVNKSDKMKFVWAGRRQAERSNITRMVIAPICNFVRFIEGGFCDFFFLYFPDLNYGYGRPRKASQQRAKVLC